MTQLPKAADPEQVEPEEREGGVPLPVTLSDEIERTPKNIKIGLPHRIFRTQYVSHMHAVTRSCTCSV